MAKPSGNLLSIGGMILFIGVLALLPKLLHRTEHTFPTQKEQPTSSSVSLTEKFPLIFEGAKKRATLQTLGDMFAGHPTIILNLWATWCPPCIEELPSLEYLHRSLQNQPLEKRPRVVTISVDAGTKEIFDLFATLEFKPTFPVLWDKDGAYSQKLGTTRFPETYWIDREGKILHKWIGPQQWVSDAVLRKLAER